MRISSVVPGNHDLTRRVGLRFEERLHAIKAAVHLYRTQGLDVDVDEEAGSTVVWVEAPRHLAPYVMGLLERATGTPGFNEWEQHHDDYGTTTT